MTCGVIPGTVLYAAAVLSFAAAMSLDMFEVGKFRETTEALILLGRDVAYFPFVTLLKIAVAIAPKRSRAVPARPAAVPLLVLVNKLLVTWADGFLHILLVKDTKSN